MNKKRRVYDKQFKIDAVRFYEESGKKLTEVENELGTGAGCISHWRRELEDEKDEAFRGNGNMTEEQKELTRLRKEVEVLREEREILKKVVGMFSKPSR
jgi:transposase